MQWSGYLPHGQYESDKDNEGHENQASLQCSMFASQMNQSQTCSCQDPLLHKTNKLDVIQS